MCCSLKINSVENYFRWLCLSLTLQSRCQFTVANFQQGVRALWARSGTYSDGFFLASGSTFDIGSNAPRAAAWLWSRLQFRNLAQTGVEIFITDGFMLLPDHLLISEVMPPGPLLTVKQVAIQKSDPGKGWNLHYWTVIHDWQISATDIIVKIFDSSLFPPSGQFLRCQLIYSSRLPWQVWEYPELCLESGGLDIVSGYRWYQSTGWL